MIEAQLAFNQALLPLGPRFVRAVRGLRGVSSALRTGTPRVQDPPTESVREAGVSILRERALSE